MASPAHLVPFKKPVATGCNRFFKQPRLWATATGNCRKLVQLQLVDSRGMLYPQGFRVRVPTGKGTSPGSEYPQYPCGYVPEDTEHLFCSRNSVSVDFLMVFKKYLNVNAV